MEKGGIRIKQSFPLRKGMRKKAEVISDLSLFFLSYPFVTSLVYPFQDNAEPTGIHMHRASVYLEPYIGCATWF
jgi:hypothetical protein